MVQVECSERTMGRLKEDVVEVVRKDMADYDLMEDMALDRVAWWNRICVTKPK